MNPCNTCLHKNVCMMKNQVLKENAVKDCSHYLNEKTNYQTKFAIYDTVYIIDRFDNENNCSQIGDGTGSKKIEKVVRECFITNINIHDQSGNHLYFVQPKHLTLWEEHSMKSFYWEQSFFATTLFSSAEAAKQNLLALGLNPRVI